MLLARIRSVAGLPKPSTVGLTKLATVDRRLVLRRIGRIGPEDGLVPVRSLRSWLEETTARL